MLLEVSQWVTGREIDAGIGSFDELAGTARGQCREQDAMAEIAGRDDEPLADAAKIRKVIRGAGASPRAGLEEFAFFDGGKDTDGVAKQCVDASGLR